MEMKLLGHRDMGAAIEQKKIEPYVLVGMRKLPFLGRICEGMSLKLDRIAQRRIVTLLFD